MHKETSIIAHRRDTSPLLPIHTLPVVLGKNWIAVAQLLAFSKVAAHLGVSNTIDHAVIYLLVWQKEELILQW